MKRIECPEIWTYKQQRGSEKNWLENRIIPKC